MEVFVFMISFVGLLVFLILAGIAIVKKNGNVKKMLYFALGAFVLMAASIAMEDTADPASTEVSAEIKKQLADKNKEIEALKDENNELAAKLKEAEPLLALSEQEGKNREKEAEMKATELAKKEETKKAEEERIAAEKAKEDEKKAKKAAAAALEAKTKTLTAGKYVVGRDIEAGLYDATAVSGKGNFVVTGGTFGLKVNEMFGVGGGYYNGNFNNVELEEGDEIQINNDLKIKFTPKE